MWVHSPGRNVSFAQLHEEVAPPPGTWAVAHNPPTSAPTTAPTTTPHSTPTVAHAGGSKFITQGKSFAVFAISACVEFTVPVCSLVANAPIWLARGESAAINGLEASVLPEQIDPGRHTVCINDTSVTGRTIFGGFKGQSRHVFVCDDTKEVVVINYTTPAGKSSDQPSSAPCTAHSAVSCR